MKLVTQLSFVFLLFCIFSCKKDSTNSLTPVQLLTQQSWTLTGERWNPSNAGWSDLYQGIPSCRKDNIITYYSDLSLINNEGATKCNSSDPQIFKTATWALYENNTRISVAESSKTYYYEILQLDNQAFKTLLRDTIPPSITLYEFTFGH